MCYDLCYAGFVDTISLPSDDPYMIAPGHQDTLFYIDFTCIGQGLGTSIVRMYDTSDPSQYVQDTFKVQIGIVGITNISTLVDSYSLSQNYPNPFNPTTNINFSIPDQGTVSLKVYDILGNEISTLVNNERLTAGTYKVDFNGSSLTSGIYYYTLKTESFIDTKKMLLIK
ncbi:MAG: T9SS type A sorting domain-containing protein [Ignavibacteria bacterium]